ncbi:unnamed protein product [marine sediment metagenome]|uniref:Uncharacterized protein n=1 Tax=marine sediment metagenome TaxID=412755 RepID=X1SSN1_9ZZZZ
MSNVTNFFGEYLASVTKKETISCKGMIRLAVLDKFPGKTPEQISFNELKEVFNTSLKERLDNVSTPNTEQISQNIASYLVKNQSLLTMA